MLFEVDIKKLVKKLKNSEEAESVGLSAGAQYLLEQVYRTLVMESPLTVGEVDFSKFDYEDVQEFTGYFKHDLNSKTKKIESAHELFANYSPKVISQRAFF